MCIRTFKYPVFYNAILKKSKKVQMIDILNRVDIFSKLENLHVETNPVFGKMTPQHMIEHLNIALMFSNGKMPQKLYVPENTAAYIKNTIIYTDAEMPLGYKAPMLTDDLPKLYFPSLEAAIAAFKIQLDDFDNYLKNNPEAIQMHPTMGELDNNEWIVFHNKHFNHHFKQFGLV